MRMKKKTKKLSKKLAALILTTVLAGTFAAPAPVQAAEWHRDNTGWWWQEKNGTYPVSKWEKINGKWYHFNQSGYMDTGWYKEGTKWYYLGGTNDGAMKTGWNKVGTKWYYLGGANDGAMKTGWYQEGINYYYFDDEGAMKTGWLEVDGYRYLLGDDGIMKRGWQEVNGKHYYFYLNGTMARYTIIDGYEIGADGSRVEKQGETETPETPETPDTPETPEQPETGEENKDKTYTIDLGNGKTTTVVGYFDTDYANQVVELVNEYRAEKGLAPLTVMTDLSDASCLRSYETAYYFSHTRPNGESCFSVISNKSIYNGMGENIAAGYATPEAVMKGWKESSGHNANMLGNYDCIGVGCFITKGNGSYGQYRYYWVQIFGKK